MYMQLTLLLLPVAATCGWLMGKWDAQKVSIRKKNIRLRHDYFKGLNYLINDQADKAVDVFIKLIEVDSDTIETHLALGNLFRQRGEVDRAIRVHQNLIVRPNLQKQHHIQALLALGQDYLRAGVLDRAENLFLELVKMGEESQLSLRYLLQIYQQEKDWPKAIEIAKKLEAISGESMHGTIAHYYCELALQMEEKNSIDEARELLERAQKIDRHCARASWLRGRLEQKQQCYDEAIQYYKKVKHQDVSFFSEIVGLLSHCYQKLGKKNQYIDYLHDCVEETSCFSTAQLLAEHLRTNQDNDKAIEFISEQIKRKPSLKGVGYLVNLYLKNSHGDTKEKLLMLHNFIQALLAEKPKYQCSQCGFSSKTLFWLCPSCQHWATLKPILGLEGG